MTEPLKLLTRTGDAVSKGDGNTGVPSGNAEHLGAESLSFLSAEICIVPLGVKPPQLGAVLEKSCVCTLQC